MGSWRGTRFFLILGSFLDALLGAFWTHLPSQIGIKSIQGSTHGITSTNLHFGIVSGTLFGPHFGQKIVYFRTFFGHRFCTCVLPISRTCSNPWNLKKHCISAVKHVFPQGSHFTNNRGKSQILHAFWHDVSTILASISTTFPMSIFALIFDAILDAIWAKFCQTWTPKSIQNRSKKASENRRNPVPSARRKNPATRWINSLRHRFAFCKHRNASKTLFHFVNLKIAS